MNRLPNRRFALRRQHGLSLIELMVAITIGMFLLVGLVAAFATQNRAYLELNRSAQQVENGRFAIQILADDLALAGHYGRFYSSVTAPGSLPDPCEINSMSALRGATALPVQGYNAPASAALPSCIGSTDHVAGTDILVIRRTDSQVTASGSLVANEVYLQGTPDLTLGTNPVVALGTASNFTLKLKDNVTTAPIRKLHVHIYYVAPCSVPAGGGTTCTGASDDGGAPIPTLKRLELKVDTDGTRRMVVTPLVEGIENFQVDYGLDADTDGVPDSATFTVDPSTVANWVNVVAVRVNVLARNLEATSGYTDDKTYDMGIAGAVTPGGAFKRHVYNSIMRIENVSARREAAS